MALVSEMSIARMEKRTWGKEICLVHSTDDITKSVA